MLTTDPHPSLRKTEILGGPCLGPLGISQEAWRGNMQGAAREGEEKERGFGFILPRTEEQTTYLQVLCKYIHPLSLGGGRVCGGSSTLQELKMWLKVASHDTVPDPLPQSRPTWVFAGFSDSENQEKVLVTEGFGVKERAERWGG